MRRISLLVVALFIYASQSAQAAAPLYKIKDLTPSGYTGSVAYDINASGDAVGVAERFVSGSREEAYFYYDHSAGTSTVFGVGTILPRSAITGTGFRDAAINDSGLVAGSARFTGPVTQTRGFIYDGTTITNLGTLAGATATGIRPASDALDINSSGLATGTATSGAGTINAEGDNLDVYTGTASPITDIDGDITVVTRGDRGRAINNAGTIVGQNELGLATLFVGPSETILLATTSIAFDLNESGQVVVENSLTTDTFRYEPGSGTLTAIPQIGTGSRMFGKAINEDGDIVGWGDRSGGTSGQGRGFVYLDDDATSYILEDHIVDKTFPTGTNPGDWGTIGPAWGINDSGWIVGEGSRRFTGATFPTNRAYLLIPVPEPCAVFLLGMLVLASSMRRKL